MARVKEAAPADFPVIFEELLTTFPQDDDDRHDAAVRYFLGFWLAKNMDAAFAFALHREYPGDLTTILEEIMCQAWPEKALALLGKPGHPTEYGETALQRIARLHPEVYLRFDPQGTGDSYGTLWSTAMKELIARDPAAAAEAWVRRKLDPDAVIDTGLIFTVVSAWQSRDSAAARNWAQNLGDEDSRRCASHAWLSALARKSPGSALKELPGLALGTDVGYPSLGDSTVIEESGDARLEIAGRLAMQDFAAALVSVEKMAGYFPEKEYSPDQTTLDRIRQWMVTAKVSTLPDEPAAFLDELDSMSRAVAALGGNSEWWQEEQKKFLPDKLATWNAADCLDGARQRSPAGENDLVLREMLRRAAQANPSASLAALPDMPPESQSSLTRFLFEFLPGEDTEHRSALLRQLPAAEWDNELAESLRGQAAEYAPLIATLPAAAMGSTRPVFAEQWAEWDPAAAAAWLATLPDWPHSYVEAGAVARTWARLDETGASDWLSSLPRSVARDYAASKLIEVIAPSDPEAAWQWAMSIDSPESRLKALGNVEAAWGNEAPEALGKAMDEAAGVLIRPRGDYPRNSPSPP